MNRTMLPVWLTVLMVNVGLPGRALALDVYSSATMGIKSMDLAIRDREFSPSFTTINLSLTGAANKFYVSFDHERSLQDDIERDPNGLIFWSRQDTNLTFGYNVYPGINVFGGFRRGTSDAYYDDNVNTLSRSFGASSEGLYLGASYSKRFEKGSFQASVAIASLNGEISFTEPLVDTTAFTLTDPPSVVEGEALGASYVLGWTGPVSDKTDYLIQLKIHRYTFDDTNVYGGLDLSYDENFTTLYIGLGHFF